MKRWISRREKRELARRKAWFWFLWKYDPVRQGVVSKGTGRFVPDEELMYHPWFAPRGVKYKGKRTAVM